MAKGKDEEIPTLKTPWEGYAKKRVQERIVNEFGSRAGWHYVTDETDEGGFYHILGFASKEECNEYINAPDKGEDGIKELLLYDLIIPISAEQGDIMIVDLKRRDSSDKIMSLDGKVVLNLTLSATRYNPTDKNSVDSGEVCSVTLYSRTSSSQPWTQLGAPFTDLAAGDITLDISDRIAKDVSYQIRAIATGSDSGKTSPYVMYSSVVKTEVSLSLDTVGTSYIQQPRNGLQLYFHHTGAVERILKVRAYDTGGTNFRYYDHSLGNQGSGDTSLPVEFKDTDADSVKVTTAGVHRVEAWIEVDAGGTVKETPHLQAMIMMEGNESSIALNDVADKVVNWGDTVAAKWSSYVPSGVEPPHAVFKLVTADDSKVLWQQESVCVSGQQADLHITPEVDTESGDTIAAILEVYIKEKDPDNPLYTIAMPVDNTVSLAPTNGATFILDPRGRDNATKPDRIINSATGEETASDMTGMTFRGSDGWVTDSQGHKCLRVPTGASVNIDYSPFEQFGANSGIQSPSMTMEMDIAVRNVADDTKPLLTVLPSVTSAADGADEENTVGFTLRALDAYVMTSDNVVRRNQDIGLTEGERTHIAVNIVPMLKPGGSGKGINIVRIFVNGVISREFSYSGRSAFEAASKATISIGGEGAGIDVYGIRVYNKPLSADNIFADRVAALPDTESKRALREANDITASGDVSYEKVKWRYNTLLWYGDRARYANFGNTKDDKFVGSLDINIVGDPAHSGTISDMTEKGQGTSSMSYYKWNGQFDFTEESVWTDGNGVEHTDGYALWDGLPAATKLVAKINYASSQQSHKMGSCNLYDDLWKKIVGGNKLTEDDPGRRVAVPQMPFMLFVQGEGETAPHFEGLATFGPGKGDAATFGFDKEAYPGYLCIEGADNDKPLLMHRVPWSSDVSLDEKKKDICYAGEKQLSVVGGNVSDANIGKFKEAFNFVYLHYPNIRPWKGDAGSLNSDTSADKSVHYWLDVNGASRYDLMRYDPVEHKWVDAGLRGADGQWGKVNLATDSMTSGVATTGDSERINKLFKAARAQDFKNNVKGYFNVNELLFVMCFCKLIAASDNRGKNTYLYIDPATDPETGLATSLIGFHQDDLDTIFATNNTGQREKPYWVEEHDTTADGGTYWNSGGNGLYNAVEEAFDNELREMMRRMLTAMVELAPADDKTPTGCMERYYFRAVGGFPAVAYNETAELRYEAAAIAMADGAYSNNTDPLTQSLGDSVTAERQWVRSRIDYISSWAAWGKYDTGDGNGSSGTVSFRSKNTSSGGAPTYGVTLTAHNAMYPVFAIGQTTTRGTDDGTPKRLMPGESAEFNIGQSDGNTNIVIAGADNIRSLGDWTGMSLGDELTVNALKLRKFEVESEGVSREFRPTKMIFNAPIMTRLVLRNVSELTSLDLSGCAELRYVDLRGTSVTSLTLADGCRVEDLYLPASLTSLTLSGAASLKIFDIAGCKSMKTLDLAGTPKSHVRTILDKCANDGAHLSSVNLGKVDWRDGVPIKLMRTIASADMAEVSGRISLSNDSTNMPTFADKMRWITLWGDIDSADNALTVDGYSINTITSVVLRGDTMPLKTGNVTFEVKPSPAAGNDVSSVEWSLEPLGAGEVRGSGEIVTTSGAECVVKVGRVYEYENAADVPATPPELLLTVTLTKRDGATLTAQAKIACYSRPAVPGDYVFYDGSYAPSLGTKTPVGVCFYVDPNNPDHRLCAALKTPGSYVWGMNQSDWNNTGFQLTDNPSINVFNKPPYGFESADTFPLSDSSILNDDGNFKAYPTTSGMSRIGWTALPAGVDYSHLADGMTGVTNVPWGMRGTLAIIALRNTILGDSGVNLPTPEVRAQSMSNDNEIEALNNCLAEAPSNTSSGNKAKQLYFPAASACYHWQPTGLKEGEELTPKLKRHRWFLPTEGELVRLMWYFIKGYSNNEGNIEYPDPKHDIFAQSRADNMLLIPNNTHISSCENGNTADRMLLAMYQLNGRLDICCRSKGDMFYVWPVAAF